MLTIFVEVEIMMPRKIKAIIGTDLAGISHLIALSDIALTISIEFAY